MLAAGQTNRNSYTGVGRVGFCVGNSRHPPNDWHILLPILSGNLLLLKEALKVMVLELGSQPDSNHETSGVTATKSIGLKRQEARDRRLAAIHEAGHHIIARHRGMHVIGSWIERAGDPTRGTSAWGGRCRWHNASRTSKVTRCMIGVAGMVAEALWKAGNDPCRMDSISDILDDPNCMSESDWRTAGIDPDSGWTTTQERAIERVTDLLRGPLRVELLAQARKLIFESRYS
jgi:hypothetical protein